MKTKPRDSLIIATKVAGLSHGWMRAAVREGTTSLDRHHIIRAIEASLKKLQTDYGIYTKRTGQITGCLSRTSRLWTSWLKLEVRIIGCSNETAWGLTKSLMISEMGGVARYETIQNNFSLNNRRFEDELAQVCRPEKVSLIPPSLSEEGCSQKVQRWTTPRGVAVQ